jgi:hypothetical protein
MPHILIVTSTSGNTLTTNEQIFADLLAANGYTWTLRARSLAAPAGLEDDYAAVLLLAGAAVMSEANTATYTRARVGIFLANGAATGAMPARFGLTTTTSPVASQGQNLSITQSGKDAAPGLSTGYSVGSVANFTDALTYFRRYAVASLPAGHIAAATVSGDAVIWAVETDGARHYDMGPAEARRVVNTSCAYSDSNWNKLTAAGLDLHLLAMDWAVAGAAAPAKQVAHATAVLQNPGGWVDYLGGSTELVTAIGAPRNDAAYIEGLGAIEYRLSDILNANGVLKRVVCRKSASGGNTVNLLVEVLDPDGLVTLSSNLIPNLTDAWVAHALDVSAATYDGECIVRFTGTEA